MANDSRVRGKNFTVHSTELGRCLFPEDDFYATQNQSFFSEAWHHYGKDLGDGQSFIQYLNTFTPESIQYSIDQQDWTSSRAILQWNMSLGSIVAKLNSFFACRGKNASTGHTTYSQFFEQSNGEVNFQDLVDCRDVVSINVSGLASEPATQVLLSQLISGLCKKQTEAINVERKRLQAIVEQQPNSQITDHCTHEVIDRVTSDHGFEVRCLVCGYEAKPAPIKCNYHQQIEAGRFAGAYSYPIFGCTRGDGGTDFIAIYNEMEKIEAAGGTVLSISDDTLKSKSDINAATPSNMDLVTKLITNDGFGLRSWGDHYKKGVWVCLAPNSYDLVAVEEATGAADLDMIVATELVLSADWLPFAIGTDFQDALNQLEQRLRVLPLADVGRNTDWSRAVQNVLKHLKEVGANSPEYGGMEGKFLELPKDYHEQWR